MPLARCCHLKAVSGLVLTEGCMNTILNVANIFCECRSAKNKQKTNICLHPEVMQDLSFDIDLSVGKFKQHIHMFASCIFKVNSEKSKKKRLGEHID